jgi:hypothetical protein
VAHKTVIEDPAARQENNHHCWRGLGAAAVGVISRGDGLLNRDIQIFEGVVDQINSAGAFPLEMQRKGLTIHYQGFAFQPLIPLAEFAERHSIIESEEARR